MKYRPTWSSLRTHPTPSWFRDAKFGIYTHWGIYSVPAFGPNGSWYPSFMYTPGTVQHAHHRKTYGGPQSFGYKDFLPKFDGRNFDPASWASLFRRAGAQFAGPVAEHHDGFSMWASDCNPWNASQMGPRRDVVGELTAAYRAEGLKVMAAFHHAEHWKFYPHWRLDCDVADPRYAGLYGEIHDTHLPETTGERDWDIQAAPSRAFLDLWARKIREVDTAYRPDLIWFDFGLNLIPEPDRRAMIAEYYNRAADQGREVVFCYKNHDAVPGSGIVDIELGGAPDLQYHEWITDTTVDAGEGWGYLENTSYRSPTSLIHYLIDNISKNGALLLNVGPRPDGSLPDVVVAILEEIGSWLRVNGEAVYATSPWIHWGTGPTKPSKSGPFSDLEGVDFTSDDFRFTAGGDAVYVHQLGRPGAIVQLPLVAQELPGRIRGVELLGWGPVPWSRDGANLRVETPSSAAFRHAAVWKVALSGEPG